MSQQQSRSAYKQAQYDLIDYLDREVFAVHLVEPSRVTAHEIFCYSDGNQAKHHIRGSLRAAIHTGLNDPQMYLDVSGQVPHEWLAHAISLVQAPRVIAHVGNVVPEKHCLRQIFSWEIKSLNNINGHLYMSRVVSCMQCSHIKSNMKAAREEMISNSCILNS